jgi:chemotaxis protein MotA
MDIMTILGVGVGISAVYFALHEGGIASILYNPIAALLVYGGTLGSIMVTFPWQILKRAPKAVFLTVFPPKILSAATYVDLLVRLSEKSKKNGLDSLQEDISKMHDPFLVDGLQMLLDGFDPELVRENLEKELVFLKRRHNQVTSIFRSCGTYAPIFGLLGTLIGVVQVLRNLTDPESLGPSMAIAITATFYGIFGANFLFLPTAGKLNALTDQEVLVKEVAIEGILAIQNGDIPTVVSRKLHAYLAYKLRQNKTQKK